MTLSILTINYNNASGLRKTVESVLTQTSQDFEFIVVDGASTDGSLEFLTAKFQFSTVNCKFISEPDNGIYHAMNKGINIAKGDYIHFLNSGDWLVDAFVVKNMLKELDNIISSGNQPDVFVGNKITVRSDGKVRYGKNDKQLVTALTFYRGTIEHTSAYIRRAMFETVGLYDENLKIVSDWKWYFEAVLHHNAKVAFTDIYVSYFDNTGISSTNLALDKTERRQVLENILPAAVLADYDRFHLAIDQNERLKRYPLIYKFFYLVERVLFKLDKWNANIRGRKIYSP
jgi:glycosyltransferase involved in cell wall biosynthesis